MDLPRPSLSLMPSPWWARLVPRPGAGRSAAVRADVAARLSRVCAEMAPAQLDLLLDAICARKLRWEAEDDPDVDPEGPPEAEAHAPASAVHAACLLGALAVQG